MISLARGEHLADRGDGEANTKRRPENDMISKNKLQRIVKVCSKISGTTLKDVSDVHKVRTLRKAQSILDDPSHPLVNEFMLLPSGRRYKMPRCGTNKK